MSEIVSKIWRRRPARAPTAPDTASETDDPGGRTGEGAYPRYANRDLSDLLFIRRVLDEAGNPAHPLLERLRFLSISAQVLDQFYTVRIARLRHDVKARKSKITPDGMTPAVELRMVTREANALMSEQEARWTKLQQELSVHNITFLSREALAAEDLDWLHHYFRSNVLHVVTPFIVDQEHPFPFVPSGGLCALLEFTDRFILIPFPQNLSRFVALPGDGSRFVFLETVIFCFWPELVVYEELLGHGVFQILRDNDLALEERSDDLRAMVESGLRTRHKANVTRLKVTETMSESAIRFVTEQLGVLTEEELALIDDEGKPVSSSEFIFVAGTPGVSQLAQVIELGLAAEFPQMLFDPYTPRYPQRLLDYDNDCFAAISHGDLLVHWPYESFDPVVEFVRQAAKDPDVRAIKQTLYRTSDESPLVQALIAAAQAGKSALAVIELEARDNEQSNVQLAKRLEAAGVQIIYGIIGLKIHCKVTLVVRREGDESVTYAHFGTGNYHPVNARTYTDLSLFTRSPTLGADAHRVLSYLTSGKLMPVEQLVVAPIDLRDTLYELIDNEVINARAGKPAHICIKTNSLTDTDVIDRLYDASEAGVEVDLVVRRHCVLRPGMPGLSSRIRVKSIVGRFLEHSRIFLFANGARPGSEDNKVFIGSADLMKRNLDERVELLVPVEDPDVRRLLVNGILHANLKDTRQSWLLNADNEYSRHPEHNGFCAQSYFMSSTDPAELGDPGALWEG